MNCPFGPEIWGGYKEIGSFEMRNVVLEIESEGVYQKESTLVVNTKPRLGKLTYDTHFIEKEAS